MNLIIFIPGQALPQGSKKLGRAFTNPATGRTTHSIIDNNPRLANWRLQVTNYVRQEMSEHGINAKYPGPVTVTVSFRFARPLSHYGTGKNADVLKPDAPVYVLTAPDLDKLQRAILDGCTDAGLWVDDSQVVIIHATKRYVDRADRIGAQVRVEGF